MAVRDYIKPPEGEYNTVHKALRRLLTYGMAYLLFYTHFIEMCKVYALNKQMS